MLSKMHPLEHDYRFVALIIHAALACVEGNVCSIQVQLSAPDVLEGNNVSLECTSKQNLPSHRWTLHEYTVGLGMINGTCTAFGFLKNSSLYKVQCGPNETTSVEIKTVSRDRHGEIWTCVSPTNAHCYSSVTIRVKVPVRTVSMYPTANEIVSIEENSTQNFICNTSFSYPDPIIAWFLENGDLRYNMTEFSVQTTYVNEKNFTSAQSELIFRPNRTFNNWSVLCEASNVQGVDSIAGRLHLNITYPPDGPPRIDGYGINDTYKVITSKEGRLSCVVEGGNPEPYLTWECDNHPDVWSFRGENIVIQNITWTAARGQSHCICKSNYMSTTTQSHIHIDVLYPPTLPVMEIHSKNVTGTVKIIENNHLEVICSSMSNPSPSIEWYDSSMLDNGNILNITKIGRAEADNYMCKVSNDMIASDGSQQLGNNESSIGVDVLFPPENPSFRYIHDVNQTINGNSIHVIKMDNFKVVCHFHSNPDPRYRWNDGTEGNDIEFSAIKASVNRACNATNTMIETVGETRSSSHISTLSVIVLYPPENTSVTYADINGILLTETYNLSIIEGTSFTLTCKSHSRPKPGYRWYVNGTEQGRSDVIEKTIKRNEGGTFTCQAFNSMQRTFGDMVTGLSNKTTVIDVLFPAEFKHELMDTSVVEGDHFIVTCQVVPGNPSNTFIQWSRDDGVNITNKDVLQIHNVTRDDDRIYTCSLFNEMKPSGSGVVKYPRRTQFHLNVFFSARVASLSANGYPSTSMVVINDTEILSFKCTVKSNPLANISLIMEDGVKETTHGKSELLYNVTYATYKNAGVYVCTGRNNYTHGESSKKEMTIIVKGRPRPYLDSSNHTRIYTKLHKIATMPFTAHPYVDENGTTTFSWYNGTSPIYSEDERINITTDRLKSELVLQNIVRTDFKNYTLHVNNSVGSYIQLYEVIAKDTPDTPQTFSVVENSITYSNVTVSWTPGFNGGSDQTFRLYYKTTEEPGWTNTSVSDTGASPMEYTINELISDTEYLIKIQAANEEGLSDETEEESFRTKIVPTKRTKQSYASAIAGGTISGIIVILAVILVIWFVRKRRGKGPEKLLYQNVPFGVNTQIQRKKHADRQPPAEMPMESLQDVDDTPHNLTEPTEYCNSGDVIENLRKIKICELFAFVLGRTENDFEADYQKLPSELQMPCTFARKPENIALNRYKGIFPYDHSRVKLAGQPEFFMNACYIDGYHRRKAYIASLGPTIKTTNKFDNFWKMVWYEQSDIIVMLTNLHEISGPKCDQYWPELTESYGEFDLSCQNKEVFAEYTVRYLTISFRGEVRRLTHLHYTAWPDKTVPEDATTLLEFRHRVKSTPTSSNGPWIVHCSAGIGRTGTLIALDRLIAEGQNEGSVDVFACVNSMREQRVKMVQTLEQYIYIYKALVSRLHFECETVPLENFNEYVHATNNNIYSEQFQRLKQTVDTDSKEGATARSTNESLVAKNRVGADVPGSRYRVRLFLNREQDESDYINAVYVNSFRQSEHFIIAQSPLSNTVTDFICMIYQTNCCCVVTMEDMQEPGMNVGRYVPSDLEPCTFGDFHVSCVTLDRKPQYTVREMRIQNSSRYVGGEKVVYHFHYNAWMPGNDTPRDVKQFVQFVKTVEEYADQLGEDASRVLVHCLKASERSALFCVVAILMEKIRHERQVNVLHTVRHIRTRRREAITSMEQLKFCYQATDTYIGMLEC